MKHLLKSFIPEFYFDYLHKKRIDSQVSINFEAWREKVWKNWKNDGAPVPPPHAVKQKVIADFQKKYSLKTLVETGTLHGEMIEAQKRCFQKVYSIELDEKLYNEAVTRFKYDRNVQLVNGDSGVKLFEVIKEIDTLTLFWLDGHYSGGYTALGELECPILGEIDGVFSGKIKNHILLIDDARCFVGENSYPTKEDLYAYILKYNKNYKMSVDCDIIRFEVG
jgi:hypothetical protein